MQTTYRKKLVSGVLFAALIFSLLFACLPLSASAAGNTYRLKEEVTGASKIVYSYDKAGRLTQKTSYYDGKVEDVTEYRYYPDGGLFEELWKGSINLYTHYDSMGTQIERDETGGIGSPAFSLPMMGDVVSTQYDAGGRITRFELKSEDYTMVLRYAYDSKGRILRFTVNDTRTDSYDYRPDGSFIRTRRDGNTLFITEYYDASGLRTQCDRNSSGYTETTYYEYDDKGHLTRQYDAAGGSEWVKKYDTHGNLTEEWFNGKRNCTYQNSYDKNGCLTKSVRKAGSFSQTTTYRYEKA